MAECDPREISFFHHDRAFRFHDPPTPLPHRWIKAKGPGSRAAGVAMAYKLIEAAQARWRVVNAPHLVALVRNGAVFHKGKLLERPVDITAAAPAESGETEVA